MRVLVVDDEPAVRQALDRALRFEGYQTEAAEDGPSALGAHAERPADAIVLDVAMPRMDGLEVCRRLRQAGDHTPVLMLTARAAVNDRVAGLDAGADDYLVKPFALEELLARIRALLRRSAPLGDDEVLRFADLSLDPGTREVRRGSRSMELTRTEFLLLELLLRNARQVLPRELIFDRVWGYDFGANSNSLEVYIGYLRRKTEAGGEPRLIHTVRGVGYVLRQPVRGVRPVTAWLRRQSFRVRLGALVAAAVGVTVALAALASYFAVRHQLYSQVDSSLKSEMGSCWPARDRQRRPRSAGTSSACTTTACCRSSTPTGSVDTPRRSLRAPAAARQRR